LGFLKEHVDEVNFFNFYLLAVKLMYMSVFDVPVAGLVQYLELRVTIRGNLRHWHSEGVRVLHRPPQRHVGFVTLILGEVGLHGLSFGAIGHSLLTLEAIDALA
jgi:hypothetical protein